MNSLPRGVHFIINNEKFDQPLKLSERNGTNFDAEGLHKLFNALEFESQIYDNVTVEQMKNLCDHYAKTFKDNYDCIICAILTHGKEGKLYGVDGTVKIKELTEKFQVEKLKGKPKLFFFQACQGKCEKYMESCDGIDGKSRSQTESGKNLAFHSQEFSIPIEADFMYAYSTVPGYLSWRSSDRGSWFIQSIIEVFSEHATSMDLLRMMTRVNADVAKLASKTEDIESDKKKQIPSIVSQLRKDFISFHKISSRNNCCQSIIFSYK
ncbi:LOW QUALITY PROTEIN: caspase-7-like [Xenia sp. Carnegie-2017]|uniref:LOW QUALITY PROTEIN: caspase-7-like n=1 Tax=Xenia sp. Carnegie-2017 TaxID=2897299 RepID=UPI001F038789|nr:LOW QUALITY PROTEIN: caspase-7-like [Xenia sp. Carnegie-2017]